MRTRVDATWTSLWRGPWAKPDSRVQAASVSQTTPLELGLPGFQSWLPLKLQDGVGGRSLSQPSVRAALPHLGYRSEAAGLQAAGSCQVWVPFTLGTPSPLSFSTPLVLSPHP